MYVRMCKKPQNNKVKCSTKDTELVVGGELSL